MQRAEIEKGGAMAGYDTAIPLWRMHTGGDESEHLCFWPNREGQCAIEEFWRFLQVLV
jgi:hypothetical protein